MIITAQGVACFEPFNIIKAQIWLVNCNCIPGSGVSKREGLVRKAGSVGEGEPCWLLQVTGGSPALSSAYCAEGYI